MRMARVRACWALTAAGTLGLTVAASAQAPKNLPKSVHTAPISAAVSVDGASCRIMEIRVELAWLAHPDTFPYELVAHSTGASLEVGGMVPSEAAHTMALQVAKTESKLPVVDRLLVIPGAGNSQVRKGDADLCRAAHDALGKLLAGRDEPFQVAADASGQITILGTVPSCEDKLRVSRRMSQLPGCTAVVNSMVVTRVTRDGKVHTPLTSDGVMLVAGDPLDLLPPPAASIPTNVATQSSFVPGQAGVPVELVNQPAHVGVVHLESVPPGAVWADTGKPVVQVGHVENAPKIQPVACQNCVPCKDCKACKDARTCKDCQKCVACEKASVEVAKKKEWPKVGPNGRQRVAQKPQPQQPPQSSPYAMGGLNKYTPPGPLGSPYAAVYTAPKPLVPEPLPTAVAAAPVVTPPAAPAAPKFAPVQQAVAVKTDNKPVIKQASATMPAKPETKPELKPLPAKSAPVVKPLTPNQLHIKRLVEVAVGDLARDLELKPQDGNRIVISLRVRNAADGQRLGERILAMPELEPYKVDLEMEVKP